MHPYIKKWNIFLHSTAHGNCMTAELFSTVFIHLSNPALVKTGGPKKFQGEREK